VPFVPGDVANASSYSFPVCFQTVEGATADSVLRRGDDLDDAFVAAAKRLEENGVRAITGDCGYMIRYQDAVAEAAAIPVFISSLLQIPMLLRMTGGGNRLGLFVASAEHADDELLALAGVDAELRDRISLVGLEDRDHFRSAILDETGELDQEAIESEVVDAAVDLVERDPAVSVIALECSNLPPYSAAIRRATGRPVFDWIGFINYVHQAIAAPGYGGFY
jgi:hypothetical protein